jgi:hypothetical protein
MVLEDLALLLQTAGLGTLASTLFKSGLPMDVAGGTTVDAVIALIEVPGLPSQRVHERTAVLDQPVVQVIIRGEPHGYADARTRAQAVFTTLDGLSNQTLGGVSYLWITALQPPFFLKSDELERPLIAFNVRCLCGRA